MRYQMKLLGLVLGLSLCLPVTSFAVKAHDQACNECHRTTANARTLSNVCTPCHSSTSTDPETPPGQFTLTKASDAFNHSGELFMGNPGEQTSHFWGGASSNQVAAGSTYPPTSFYYSRYSISTNRVTCTICHDPHKQVGTKLLRMTIVDDLICRQCHVNFYKDYDNAILTHPVGATANYAAALLASPTKYKATPANAAPGVVGLVNGVVSCSSCHAPHYADSDSLTPDGLANVGSLQAGDGHMLKGNGPFKADNSLLCQTCHTYMAHGKVATTTRVGCLTCHSGHIIVGNSNVYVLRNSVTIDGTTVPDGTKTINYTTIDTIWNDNDPVTATGYCEVCHGSAETIPKQSGYHFVDMDCRECHKHQVEGGTYSFQNDANAATCGDCHGFPPYKDVRGDRLGDESAFYAERDGGYGYQDSDHNYALDAVAGGYKSEATTPHNTHAAGGLTQGNAATDYIFGGGVQACDPCHFDLSTQPTHDTATPPGSYQDLAWSSLATGNGALSPSYATSGDASVIWKCSNTYCHSNGGKRDPDGFKETADYNTPAVSPAWLAGDNVIIGNAGRCNFCHGNDAITMASTSGNKYNSQSHQKHLGAAGGMGKTYSCTACHATTADSSTALATTGINPRLVKDGGTHVNGVVNVSFKSTYSLGNGTLGTASYDGGANGTCTTYCHSNGRAPYTAIITADWDNAASGACGACHSTVAASLSAPHSKHLAITGVVCADCHGTGAAAGTHAGHVDGDFTFSQTACDNCHGWLSGEKTAVWGESMDNAYCLTCHTGTTVGVVKTMTAPNKQHATTRGHNATANYTSGNLPGNKQCTSCHLTTITNHVNVTDGDATHLVAAATTCTATCHGVGGSAIGANTKGMITHVDRACTNCHDPHGDSTLATNIYMVRSVSTGTGNYSGAVDFRVKINANSYDEVDAANADDLCATCHTYGTHPLSTHNTKTNQGIAHHEGENCMTAGCHKGHTEPTGAFVSGGGTQCNDCHGNPPVSNAQLKTYGLQYGAHAAHNFVGSPLPAEDRTDCEVCHPGAATYSLSHSNGGGAVNLDPRITSLGSGNYSCGTLNSALGCHASSATDGFWTDIDDAPYVGNGLNCTACHNASGTNDGVLANAAPNSGAHAKHKVVNKTCTDCHNNGGAITDTTHINSFGYAGAADDGAAIVDKATASLGEGAVIRNLTTYDQVTNFTCTGGVGLACHNSKVTPNWRTFTNIACTNCHNPTTSDAADPKTGLHNIGVTEAAAGVQKHDSTLPGGGCTACHNSTKPASTHANGIFLDNSAVRTDRFLTARAAEATWWADSATANRGTCFSTGALAGCHSDGGNWTRLWSTEANSTATDSGSARCNVCHGQYSTLSGSAGLGWNAGTSHYKTYGGATSTRGVSHKSQAGENNACEDCHSYTTLSGNHDTVTHQVTMNDDAVEVQVTEAAGRVYCAKCHSSGDPMVSGTYAFTQSIFPIQRVAGIHDPKQECNNCHGDGTGRYWPMAAYGTSRAENDGGRHEIHLTRLAKAKYNMTVVELLADADVKNKQIELCYYCHNATVPGTNPGHNDTGLPAEVSSTMYALWDTTRSTADAVAYTGNGANGTGTCAAVNCHNGKNTNSLGATFYWHASGTQNCILCHNDIASGATGTTHQAHIGAGNTIFGKTMNCGSCHGGSPTWEGDATPNTYTVPATNHIDGLFRIGTDAGAAPGATVSFSYSPNNYVDYAAHTFGSCGINLCHNNGKYAAAPAYTWGVTTFIGCAACHATTATALASSHDPHMNAAFTTTFRSTALACTDCHDAVSASDMTSKTNHMDGTINWKTGATFTYTGNASVTTPASYGTCSGACHVNHLAAPQASPAWNRTASPTDNCTICHASAPADGRHAKHMLETDYVTSCGNCHTGATVANTITSTTHFDGTRNTAGTASVVYIAGDGTCTNSCHKVSNGRDWTSGGTSPVLFCIDCHQTGTIAALKGALPTSGLHNMTANGVQKHDSSLLGTNGCTQCHAAPDPTHLNNDFVTDSGSNNDRFVNRANMVWTDGAANTGTCWDNGSSGLNYNAGAGCHRDDGHWKRLWSTAADVDISINKDPGQLVCDVCHGQYQTLVGGSQGWREGTVHYRSGGGAVGGAAAAVKGSSHTDPSPNQCQDCHGYPVAGSHNSNSKIEFSGGGTVYTLNWGTNGWFCGTACHKSTDAGLDDATLDAGRSFLDSLAFPSPTRATPEKIVYVTGTTTPEGGCTGCHGNTGNGTWWPDGVANPSYQAGSHNAHIVAISAHMDGNKATPGSLSEKNDTCRYCHPNPGSTVPDHKLDTGVAGRVDLHQDGDFLHLVTGIANGSGVFNYDTDGTCSTIKCHARAPYTPGWLGDTIDPGTVTLTAVTHLPDVPPGTHVAGVSDEPGSVRLSWTAPGDDGSLDGTAYSYDLRYSLTQITDDATFNAAKEAQVPKVMRKGQPQTMIVKGLNPGTPYYFALKTYDETGRVSPIAATTIGVAAHADDMKPVFWGVSSVSATDHNFDITPNPDTNSVYVSWEAGRDHSHSLADPLDYLVLWSEYSLRTHFTNNGAMPATIGVDACFNKSVSPPTPITCGTGGVNEYRIKSAETTALDYNVTGLPVGTVYNFLVRARDANLNIDTNRADMMAMAKSTSFKTIALQTQRTSGTIPTVSTGWTGLPGGSTSASDAALGADYPGSAPTPFTLGVNAVTVWSPTTTYSVPTNVWGLKYQIKITASTTAATTLTYQFGYLTGKAFTAFGTAKTMSLARRSPIRLVSFPLSSFKGTIPANSKPAFVLKGGANTVTLTYGSEANKGGMLLFNAQDYNALPTGIGSVTSTEQPSTFVGGPIHRITWTPATPVAGQTFHYDVFATVLGKEYVVGRNLTTPTVDWDPVGDGITGAPTATIKVMAGNGYRTGAMINNGVTPLNADNLNHTEATGTINVNNSTDRWKPAAIGSATGDADDLKVETRPKQGAVNLTWKAVGNDGFNHGTRATQYDIRFSLSPITDSATFDALPATNRAKNEPYPEFSGAMESYELVGLQPDLPYYFAMKVGDQAGNWSDLSNVVSEPSGPKCGICHSTPPDEPATAGNHVAHGYTKASCGDCHGFAAADFGMDHQDNNLYLGWKTASPVLGVVDDGAGTVTYTQNSTLIYSDTDGVGGFNVTSGGAEKLDNGTCSGFNGTNASGCHGPAAPKWDANIPLACSACHGRALRTTGTATEYYLGRDYDATLDNAGVVPDQIKASPADDNHGTSSGRYVGAHLKHLNSSFRLAKGDNCKLCHNDNVHGDGIVDVIYDHNVAGADATWSSTTLGINGGGTCTQTSEANCHGTSATPPEWHSSATVACNQCHGFGGVDPAHVSDGSARSCLWCHPAGHPQGTEQDVNSIMIPNNPMVGIAYRSGGIHLLKNINSRGVKTTEAEVCWGCHDAQGTKISEWGTNKGIDTTTDGDSLPDYTSPYNYGALFTTYSGSFSGPTSNWLGSGTGAYWQSGTGAFQNIKAGKIQSTHSTKAGGLSTVVYDTPNKRYNESLDAVADLRCSNCHDVHNMNKAENDIATGTPYLRGTWKGNPYNEDGPPVTTTTYVDVPVGTTTIYGLGAVPRGGTGYRRLGGYFIDQNNVVPMTASATATAALADYPTTGWTNESSAGLCILCHGNDVDNMDQKPGESLWLGTNGHSNSAIGGTFTNGVNIFVNLTGGLTGLPTPVGTAAAYTPATQVPDMAYQMQPNTTTTTRGYGYRGLRGGGDSGEYAPMTATLYAYNAYDWGATVSSAADSIDQMYHQFSCSKCHNPHASRLPKLLITNCLDIQHNTWTAGTTPQTLYTATALRDVDKNTTGTVGYTAAYYASAQNCHRYNDKRTAANKGGWNKVSPWTTANQ